MDGDLDLTEQRCDIRRLARGLCDAEVGPLTGEGAFP